MNDIAIRCKNCGHPIVGCAETLHGRGWVHAATNAERCPERSAFRYRPREDGTPGRRTTRRGYLAVPET